MDLSYTQQSLYNTVHYCRILDDQGIQMDSKMCSNKLVQIYYIKKTFYGYFSISSICLCLDTMMFVKKRLQCCLFSGQNYIM